MELNFQSSVWMEAKKYRTLQEQLGDYAAQKGPSCSCKFLRVKEDFVFITPV